MSSSMKWDDLPSLSPIYVVMKTNWFLNVEGVFFYTVLYKSMHVQHGFLDTYAKKWGLLYYFLSLKTRKTMTGRYICLKKSHRLFWIHCFHCFFFGSFLGMTFILINHIVLKAASEGEQKSLNGLTSVSWLGWCWCFNSEKEPVLPECSGRFFRLKSNSLDGISFGSSITN